MRFGRILREGHLLKNKVPSLQSNNNALEETSWLTIAKESSEALLVIVVLIVII